MRRNIGEALEFLMNGLTFVKYGQKGAPKPRHIFLHDKFICWRDPKDISIPDLKTKKRKRYIPLKEITRVEEGRGAKTFAKYKNGKDLLSFSLIAESRSLDLEATSDIEKRLFLEYLKVAMANIKLDEKPQGNKLAE